MYKKLLKTEKIEVWFLLTILALIWGSSFILIKKGLEAFSPVQVGTIRMSFAFLFLLPFALKNIRKVPQGKWKIIFITGMVGNLIPAVLFALAETEMESSLTGVLNALSPLFTLLIAVYIFGFKINFIQISGLIIGFIGTIGLSFVSSNGSLGSMNVYVWLIVIATICYAVSLNLIKAYLSGMSSIVITSLAIFSVGPLSIVYLFTTDFLEILSSNTKGALASLAYLSILGIFGTAIGLILYTRLIQMRDAVFASSVTYLIPIVAILWGLLENEKIYLLHIAGMIMILIGIYFANKTEKLE